MEKDSRYPAYRWVVLAALIGNYRHDRAAVACRGGGVPGGCRFYYGGQFTSPIPF